MSKYQKKPLAKIKEKLDITFLQNFQSAFDVCKTVYASILRYPLLHKISFCTFFNYVFKLPWYNLTKHLCKKGERVKECKSRAHDGTGDPGAIRWHQYSMCQCVVLQVKAFKSVSKTFKNCITMTFIYIYHLKKMNINL